MKNRATGFSNVCIFLCNVLVMFLLFTAQGLANDLYPSNCEPGDGDFYYLGSSIPVNFDVCFKYDYPVHEYEWFVEVTIKDSKDSIVYFDHIDGFEANGPNYCYYVPGIDFKPSLAGTYVITIETFYEKEINPENDKYTATFTVTGNDLYPNDCKPANGDTYDAGSSIPISFDACFINDIAVSASEWHVVVIIKNDSTGEVVYTDTINGFGAMGPGCYPITYAPDFLPSKTGDYILTIRTFYDRDINPENDLYTATFKVQRMGNDLYPSDCKPADGDVYDLGSSIPVEFDVCFEYDYPVSTPEWHVEITIEDKDTGEEVYNQTFNGFDANGPNCYPITYAPDFLPSKTGDYILTIQTLYDLDENIENDKYTATFTVEDSGNDLYPNNCKPANGDTYDAGSSIPVYFDVCLKYDYPVSASEWHVEISIEDKDTGEEVYYEPIDGFDVNGPNCYLITSAPDFVPSKAGDYILTIQTFYDRDENIENDKYTATFTIELRDLALAKVISPKPMEGIFEGYPVDVEVQIRNEGNVSAPSADWTLFYRVGNLASNTIKVVDIAPGEEVTLKKKHPFSRSNSNNGRVTLHFLISYANDQNHSNDTGSVSFSVVPKPLWPNEFAAKRSGLLKSAGSNADDEFIEILTNQDISDPELYKVTVYDSAGYQVDTCTFDQFTKGETVDTFTVYTYSFAGDVMPDNYGGFAVSYDSLPISDFFISWGGTITAVEGDWADSTSTDIGITPEAGSSIALVGNGTDFKDFTWEISTPSPGELNSEQVVPVEKVYALPDKYELAQNYPNPFNPSTTIQFTLPKKSFTKLEIFNVMGEKIETLVSEALSSGTYKYEWNAKNLSSGVYFYRLSTENFMQSKKLLLMK
jgi:hypothetical protein